MDRDRSCFAWAGMREARHSKVSFLDRGFQSIWVVFVLVYLINASFVVMNYQFVKRTTIHGRRDACGTEASTAGATHSCAIAY